MLKKLTAIVTAFLYVLMLSAPVSADDVQTSSEADAKVQEIETRITEVTSQVDEYNKQISELQKQIAMNEEELSALEQKESELEEQLSDRMRAVYMTGSDGYLELLFSSTGISTLISNFGISQQVIKQDSTALKSLSNTKKVIEQTKTTMESELNALAEAKIESESVQAQLAKELSENEALYNSLSFREKYSGQASITEAIEAGELATSGWTWPVDANATNAFLITSLMGTRESPGGVGSSDHGGTDIGCGYGSTIVAAHAGTVIQAGSNGGYGLCVTIEGVDGFTTMYGHLSSIYVSEGDTVTAGQSLGACGSTGTSTGPHLHFEVRYGTEKINGLAFYGNDILGRLSYNLSA